MSKIKILHLGGGQFGDSEISYELIYPATVYRKKPPQKTPTNIKNDFNEASQVLNISSNASAALGRRCLQNIIRNHFNIEKKTLYDEIEKLIESNEIPNYIIERLHIIRHLGTFAVHPLKNITTTEIIDVTPEEAEAILNALSSLLDFCYFQPSLLEEEKKTLDDKLKTAGKKPLSNS